MLFKAEQGKRIRQILKELKDTNVLTKYFGRSAWTMQMQGPDEAPRTMEIKR